MNAKEMFIDYLSEKGIVVKRQLHPDINNALDIAIRKAKKEVFDDLDKVRVGEHSYPKNVCFKKTIYNQIKKKHLEKTKKE